MKKIALLATAFIGLASLQSCTIDEYYDDTTLPSQVFEITESVDVPETDYVNSVTLNFKPAIYDSDNVIVYRWEGNKWVLVPVTYGLGTGNEQLSYDYDFTRYDVKLYVKTNFYIEDLTNAEYNEFVYRQTFRVVVIPGAFAQKMNYSDYNATIKALGLEGAPVKTLSVKK